MSSTPRLVRAATLTDVPALATLIEQYWSFESIAGFEVRRVEQLLRGALSNEQCARCWLAEHAGAIIGYLLASLLFSLEHGGMTAEIDELYVAAPYRGHGIGAALLQEAESALQDRGVRRLQLQLGTHNASGREFYSARGYRPRANFELWDKAL